MTREHKHKEKVSCDFVNCYKSKLPFRDVTIPILPTPIPFDIGDIGIGQYGYLYWYWY